MAQGGSPRGTTPGGTGGAAPSPSSSAAETKAGGGEAGGAAAAAVAPAVVKKYANRRLYNTEASSYVTLEDLAQMVRKGRDFVVYDAKSGDDITRSVLTQIIVEEESKGGQNLLPTAFLRQLIAFYGDNLQSLVPRYLEYAMAGFARQQEQMRRTMEQTIGGFGLPFAAPAFPNLEEMGKQNMAMLERAMSLFSPFRPSEAGPAAPGAGAATAANGEGASVDALRAEVESLRRQLSELRAANVHTGAKPKGIT